MSLRMRKGDGVAWRRAVAFTMLLAAPVVLADEVLPTACETVDVALLADFRQVAPTPGAAPTRRTELHITQDGVTLFVAIHAFDPEPNALVARQMRRDQDAMLGEDHVALIVDAQGGRRDGWLFAVNPKGTQFDALIYDGGQLRTDWDALWHSQAQSEPDGWSARLAIPLAIFGHNHAADWRVNAERWMPRGNERVRLAGHRPDQDIHSLGDAVALPVVRSGCASRSLSARVSLRATRESSPVSGIQQTKEQIEPGLEVFHESRNGLRTAAAFNIDFGEAEADERELNLGRFELFRDEKRAFFQHDAGRFSFGGLEWSAVMPYYSRRIGLDASGQPHGLDAGLKLTGQAAGVDFGMLAARVDTAVPTGESPGRDHADVAVLRLASPLGDYQHIGLIGTYGNPEGTGGSHLWGMDYRFRDTAWQGDKTLETRAWVMESHHEQVSASAWGASLGYHNLGPTGGAAVQHIGEGFHPALGYLAEDGVLRGHGEIGWWHRTAGGEDLIPGVDWYFRRTLDGRERTVEINPEWVYRSAAGDLFVIESFHLQDQLAEGYAPLPDTWITAGRYDWHYLRAGVETTWARRLALEVNARAGEYYDGHRNDQFVALRWQPGPYWGLYGSLGRHAIRLPSGYDTARLARLRLDHTPSTRYAQSLLLQWDNLSEELGISLRSRWTWSPGREMFFALERIRDMDERRESLPDESLATLKLVWHL